MRDDSRTNRVEVDVAAGGGDVGVTVDQAGVWIIGSDSTFHLADAPPDCKSQV
jgi:hypothetical protein